MNLQKHDAETEMEMNMTPMIDVVFLLIIFFMIITDMSQKELEELKLPLAKAAVEDKPDPKAVRPIINIVYDGAIVRTGEKLYDPENPDEYRKLAAHLSDFSFQMRQKGRTKPMNDDGTGPLIPDDPLLIRADQVTPFKEIQKVMEVCGREGIRIWKIELAASQPNEDDAPNGDDE
jgi:biopolymer transport protein ExbD